jgi:hypothetical protein
MKTASQTRFNLTCVAVLALLVGCGGGGVDGAGQAPSTPGGETAGGGSAPPAAGGVGAASIGGLWSASYGASNGSWIDSTVLITEDGRAFGFSVNRNNGCAGLTYGKLTARGATFSGSVRFAVAQWSTGGSAPACTYSDGSISGSGTVSGSVTPRTSLKVTSAGSTSAGSPLATDTRTMQFDSLYSQPSGLPFVQGTWIGPTGNSLLIAPQSGELSSVDSSTGCKLIGTVSQIDTSYNAYSMYGTISGCIAASSHINGATVSGVFIVDSRSVPNKVIIGQEITLPNGTVLIAASSATR